MTVVMTIQPAQARSKTSSSGKFSRGMIPTAGGPATIKVVKAASSSRTKGSAAQAARQGCRDGVVQTEDRHFGTQGNAYEKSFLMSPTAGQTNARVRFDLKNRCTKTAELGPIQYASTADLPVRVDASLMSGSVKPRQPVFSAQPHHGIDVFAYDVDVWCPEPRTLTTSSRGRQPVR